MEKLLNNRESARLRGLDKSRDFWLRMLIPGVFLILLFVLIGFLPSEVLVQATGIGVVGILSGGAVGFLTGIRGPSWLIYVLIVAEIAFLHVLSSPLPVARPSQRSSFGARIRDGQGNCLFPL